VGNATTTAVDATCGAGTLPNPDYDPTVDVSALNCKGLLEAESCVDTCLDEIMYSRDEVRTMRFSFIVPGLVGLLFSLVLALCLYVGRNSEHKGEINVKCIAFLSVVYHLINTLPVAVLYTDMVCATDTVLGKGETLSCTMSKGAVHLVQMIFYLLAAQLFSVYMRMVWGLHPDKAKSVDRIFRWCSLCIPGGCLLVTMLVRTVTCTDETYFEIRYRLRFMCSPTLPTKLLEVVIVWSHFCISCTIIFVLSAQLIYQYAKVILAGQNGVVPKNTANQQQPQQTAAVTTTHTSKFHIVKGTEKLVVIAAIAAVCVVANLAIHLMSSVRYNEFADEQRSDYIQCVVFEKADTIEELRDKCGKHTTKKIDAIILSMGFFANAFSASCFAIVFTYDHKNLLLLKQFFTVAKNTVLQKKTSAQVAEKYEVNPSSMIDE
jgi:hypothetical protein